MSSRYSTLAKAALRRLTSAGGANTPDLSVELDAIWDRLSNANTGILSLTRDVDALALGGGSISWDEDTTAGLTWGFTSGRINFAGSVVAIAAGTLALFPSTTNYVEASNLGMVSKNATGFTAGRAPLFTVVTSDTAIVSVQQAKVLQTVLQPGGIPGALLSTAAATRSMQLHLGTISATTSKLLLCPGAAATFAGAVLVVSTGVTASDSNYWTFGLTHASTDNPMLATTAGNTTQATGGAALVAETARTLTVHPTAGNLTCAVNETLELTLTKSGTAADLVGVVLRLDFVVNG